MSQFHLDRGAYRPGIKEIKRPDTSQLSAAILDCMILARGNIQIQAKMQELLFRSFGHPPLDGATIAAVRQNLLDQLAAQGVASPQATRHIQVQMSALALTFNRGLSIPKPEEETTLEWVARKDLERQQLCDRKMSSETLGEEIAFLMLLQDYAQLATPAPRHKRLQYKETPQTHPHFSYTQTFLGTRSIETSGPEVDAVLAICKEGFQALTPSLISELRDRFLTVEQNMRLPHSKELVKFVRAAHERIGVALPKGRRRSKKRLLAL